MGAWKASITIAPRRERYHSLAYHVVGGMLLLLLLEHRAENETCQQEVAREATSLSKSWTNPTQNVRWVQRTGVSP